MGAVIARLGAQEDIRYIRLVTTCQTWTNAQHGFSTKSIKALSIATPFRSGMIMASLTREQ